MTTSLPSTRINTITRTETILQPISTLLPTQSILPIINYIPQADGANKTCNHDLAVPPSAKPACGTVATNETLQVMRNCCDGADIVLYKDGCGLYCNVVTSGYTLADVSSCIESGVISLSMTSDPHGRGSGGVICNRAASGSSVEIVVSLSGSSTVTSTATASTIVVAATSSTGSSSSTSSTATTSAGSTGAPSSSSSASSAATHNTPVIKAWNGSLGSLMTTLLVVTMFVSLGSL